jgi:hypothetical protein
MTLGKAGGRAGGPGDLLVSRTVGTRAARVVQALRFPRSSDDGFDRCDGRASVRHVFLTLASKLSVGQGWTALKEHDLAREAVLERRKRVRDRICPAPPVRVAPKSYAPVYSGSVARIYPGFSPHPPAHACHDHDMSSPRKHTDRIGHNKKAVALFNSNATNATPPLGKRAQSVF